VQLRYNLPIEILYSVVPLFMIGALFFYTARDQTAILRVSDNPDNIVNVVGKR
jgi:cytochrome c oxidase subunit II